MKCPKCSAEMDQVTYAGHEIDRCTACQGIWMQVPEFEALVGDDWLADYIDSGPSAIRLKPGTPNVINCPDCATPMTAVKDEKQPHIVYERCPKDCGVFFDAGEFKDLAQKTFLDKFKRRARVST